MAIQLVRLLGGIPVAVASGDARADTCRKLGAHGVVDRTRFEHWGRLPSIEDQGAYRSWQRGLRAFRLAFWKALGEQRDPKIVLEHPGQDTLPTSLALCDRAGMVVLCGSTSGYNGDLDLRLLWMRQKRLQGSHMANSRKMRAVIHLVGAGLLDSCRFQDYPLSAVGDAHQALLDGSGTGNLAVRVNLV